MKKSVFLLVAVTALVLSGCQIGPNSTSEGEISSSLTEDSNSSETDVKSSSQSGKSTGSSHSIGHSSSNSKSNSSSSGSSSQTPAGDHVDNDYFSIYVPEDTSMLTSNCKKYIDDMRAQEKTLPNKYKYHDLYGTSGVNIDEGSKADNQRQYLDTGSVNGQNRTVSGSIPDRSDKSMGVQIDFVPSASLKNKTYTVSYSVNQDMSNAITKSTTNNSFILRNLLVNQKYYVSVSAEGHSSEIISFTTGDYPRWILARSLEGKEGGRGIYNVRDMGGYMTESGRRVKQGLVYRGGEITKMTSSGHYDTITEVAKSAFRDDMGMVGGIELDLRGTGDITDNYNACGFAKNGDIEYVRKELKSYEQTFTRTRSLVAPIFELFKNANNKPVYYHCHGGADRTGTIGFLLNGLLGVSYTDLVIDFELTSYSSINNEHIRCHIKGYQHSYDRWPALIDQLKSDTTGGYSWNDNALLKDNIYNFLNKACSVPTGTLDTIRNIMLEPAEQNK